MEYKNDNLEELLAYIDPAGCSYQEWCGIGMALKDSRFDTLGEKIAGGDLQAAFEEAHALKGVLGNLSLTPLYESVAEITELLRSRTEMDYTPMLETIMQQQETLEKICE